jgi:hypothetical protein
MVAVHATTVDLGPGACGRYGEYEIEVSVQPVSGAACMSCKSDAAAISWCVRRGPSLATHIDQIPSPQYRVRPIAITGQGAAVGALPLSSADEATPRLVPVESEDSAGCSTTSPVHGGKSWLWAVGGLALLASSSGEA